MTTETLAFDRGSVRHYDKVGRLQVARSHISKANVCPYYGREIPDCEKLGLDPDRVYQLYRDPEELRKAAPTFNNIPVLCRHTPDFPGDPPREYRVGVTHSGAEFEYPYLDNGLSVWDSSAIAGIETDEQKELSSSYQYVADMTPGETPDGVSYDGVMRNIVGNHVALVETGRAGADVVVGDSLPPEFKSMKLTPQAVAVRAALGAYLKPRLAQDAAPKDLTALITEHKRPAAIARAAQAKYGPRLAADMEIEPVELAELLESTESAVAAPASDNNDDGNPAFDTDNPLESILALLGDKVPPEVLEKIKAALAPVAADENDNPDGTPDTVSKPAMDAAIQSATERATQAASARFKALRVAESDVRPLIGDVVAMDSAEDVYRTALEQSGIDIDGIHPSAYRSMVHFAVAQKQNARQRPAMDSAVVTTFDADFPEATKLKRGY
ncbi:hypothetical protein ABW11_21080 [Pluralibacter gergoviae]|uniref:DUF2213 domain-containing protein n=1 Tax=Pluralibacter gergoviae TaxID=61647 RepID=UPI000652385B|nr:DUF2213 domain-containing protein [Pluralibacter gergoviae]KMK23107.1 hypothetical protein ABW11_21080 [Pluralibacter gergoviae]